MPWTESRLWQTDHAFLSKGFEPMIFTVVYHQFTAEMLCLLHLPCRYVTVLVWSTGALPQEFFPYWEKPREKLKYFLTNVYNEWISKKILKKKKIRIKTRKKAEVSISGVNARNSLATSHVVIRRLQLNIQHAYIWCKILCIGSGSNKDTTKMEVHLVLKSFCPSSTLLQTEKKKK